jgi:hypothetical protein
MKRTSLTVIFCVLIVSVYGQDVILKVSGEKINATVSEIGLESIKFKLFDNPAGPTLSVPKDEVFTITYQNGTREIFNSSGKPMVKEAPKAVQKLTLADALKSGLIESLMIYGSDNTIKITVKKQDQTKPLNCSFEPGTIKCGFVEAGQIHSSGVGYRSTFSQGGISMTIFFSVSTNSLDGDGFSLIMLDGGNISIPAGESSKDFELKGNLHVNVSQGFSGFALSGMDGNITEGQIEVSKNSKTDDNKFKYTINYGNMTIKR